MPCMWIRWARTLHRTASAFCAAFLCFATAGCHREDRALVEAWIVKAPEAPFPLHVFVFHSDGTVVQSNPDAGDPATSDSNAMGVWVRDGDGIKGKIVEVMADRATRKFVSRGEISFTVKVNGDALSGTAQANFNDAEGKQLRGPIAATLEGQRMAP